MKARSRSRSGRRAAKLAPVVFDVSVLREPRARLARARAHLAVLRDSDVNEEHRTLAAEEANARAHQARVQLASIHDDAATPRGARRRIAGLLEDVNAVLAESYAHLRPLEPPRLARVRRIFAQVPEQLRVGAANDGGRAA